MGAFPRASLFNTEERKLTSTLTGKDYQLNVFFPVSYASTDTRYPVIYLLDGDIFFGMAANFGQLVSWGYKVPDHIVVGIGYNMQSYDEFGRLRELDFKIPEVQDDPPDSHAERFLAALEQEIIPFVENNYRAETEERTLYGYSSGGFFTLYALCQEPNLFRRYLAGSADLDIACPYVLAHDQKLAARTTGAPIDLYLSVGEKEGNMGSSLPAFHALVTGIQDRAYPGLRLMADLFEDEIHGPVGATLAFVHGLQKCFQG